MIKVSIVTPVYNGAAFLRTCIDSVLNQTHSNWEYLIVNNCSTDETLAIANEYARQDSRIRVFSNERFVSADENHNIAFRLVARDSKYVKVVSADDWITNDCVEKLVSFAEQHPSVGIVGCYQRRSDDSSVLWKGIPPEVGVVPGKDIARAGLLSGLHVLGAPTSVLYRADLVRAKPSFYPHTRPHADTDACYEILTHHDLGFVHEVLSFDRIHPARVTTRVKFLNADMLAYLEAVMKYGNIFLTSEEQVKRIRELENTYYEHLGRSILKMRGLVYWKFQVKESRFIGLRFSPVRVLLSALREAGAAMRTPMATARKWFGYFFPRRERASLT
jgi:glycosyltransferase involved in cell wall biosynthesis